VFRWLYWSRCHSWREVGVGTWYIPELQVSSITIATQYFLNIVSMTTAQCTLKSINETLYCLSNNDCYRKYDLHVSVVAVHRLSRLLKLAIPTLCNKICRNECTIVFTLSINSYFVTLNAHYFVHSVKSIFSFVHMRQSKVMICIH